jgi:hypothetical protein
VTGDAAGLPRGEQHGHTLKIIIDNPAMLDAFVPR